VGFGCAPSSFFSSSFATGFSVVFSDGLASLSGSDLSEKDTRILTDGDEELGLGDGLSGLNPLAASLALELPCNENRLKGLG